LRRRQRIAGVGVTGIHDVGGGVFFQLKVG
jgi:hypothetical protein